MVTERYRAGPRTDWRGYVEYNRENQMYRYSPNAGVGPYTVWASLPSEDIADYIRRGAWAPDIPFDQQLPEGF